MKLILKRLLGRCVSRGCKDKFKIHVDIIVEGKHIKRTLCNKHYAELMQIMESGTRVEEISKKVTLHMKDVIDGRD
jgi:hypothetical protein